MNDPYDLDRFVSAQRPIYHRVIAELGAGRKRSHWMWFVFPQAAGLGHSEMARRYAINAKAEAEAYLAHPSLGVRLIECTVTVLTNGAASAYDIFGSPDDMKFRSSMTLFGAIGGDPLFQQALFRFYQGAPDEQTKAILNKWGHPG